MGKLSTLLGRSARQLDHDPRVQPFLVDILFHTLRILVQFEDTTLNGSPSLTLNLFGTASSAGTE